MFKAESVSVTEDTPDSLPHKPSRRGRPPGKRTVSQATPPKSEDSTVGGANTESTSDRTGRRNKCTSAAVLLGLVKSRAKKNVTAMQQSSSSEMEPTSQRSQLVASRPKKSEARTADQPSKAERSDIKLSISRLSESELNSSAVSVSSPMNIASRSLSATHSTTSLQSPASSTPSSVQTKKRDNLIVNPDWLKPFDDGWRREVVHRGVSLTSKPTADVYYFTPTNVKLRSLPEVTDYLIKTKNHLPATCFTFIKEPIYQEPAEVVRLAGLSRGARGPRKSASGADLSSIHSSGSASPVPTETILKRKKSRIRSKTTAVDEIASSLKPHVLPAGTPVVSPSTDIDTPNSSAGQVLLPLKGRGRPKLVDKSQASIVSAAKSLLKHRWGSAVSPVKARSTGMLMKVKLPSLSLKIDAHNAAAAAEGSPPSATIKASKNSPSKKSSPMLDRRRKENTAEKHDIDDSIDDDLDLEEVLEREMAAKPSEEKDASRITIRTKPSAVSTPSTVVVIRPSAGQPVKPKLSTSVVGGKTVTTISLKSVAMVKAAGSPVVRLPKLPTATKGSTNQTTRSPSPLVLVSQIKSRTGDLTVKSMLEQKRSGGDVTASTVTNTENVTKKPLAVDGSAKTPGAVNVEQKMCGLECPGRQGIPPSLHCDMCMTLFHPQCVGLYSHFGWLNGFTCWSCRHLCRQLQSTKYQLNTGPVAATATTTTTTTSPKRTTTASKLASNISSSSHRKSPTTASTTAATETNAAETTVTPPPTTTTTTTTTTVGGATLVKCTEVSGVETVIDVEPPVVSSSQIPVTTPITVMTGDPAAVSATSSLSTKVTVSADCSLTDVVDSLKLPPLVSVAVDKEIKDSDLQEGGPSSSLRDDKGLKSDTVLPVSTTDILSSVPETSVVSSTANSSPALTSTTTSSTATVSTSSVTSTLTASGLYLDESSRQILTLPHSILSHVDMSLPVLLVAGGRCIEVKRECMITTNTSLRVFLPAACLPTDYVNGSSRPLVGQVLPRSADRPAQMIAVTLMGEDPLKALQLLDVARAAAAKAEADAAAVVQAMEVAVQSTDADVKAKSADECGPQVNTGGDEMERASQLATDVSMESKLTDTNSVSTAATDASDNISTHSTAAATDASDNMSAGAALASVVEMQEVNCMKAADDRNLAMSTNTEDRELNIDHDVDMTDEKLQDAVDTQLVECSRSSPAEATIKPVSLVAAAASDREDETAMQT